MRISPERLLIWGAGGHGRVVADVARACGHEVAGFADSNHDRLGHQAEPGGARIIVAETELLHRLGTGSPLPGGATALVLTVGANSTRMKHRTLVPPDLLPVLVHASAELSPSARLGPGTVILPRAVINAGAAIGSACIINTGAIVEHDCVLSDAVHVSPGAILLGGVHVGEASWIGAGAVVRTGISIGAGSIVGMGAVVIRDIPDHVTVVGNPARPLGAMVARH